MERGTLEVGNLNISMKDLSTDQDYNGNLESTFTMVSSSKIRSKVLVFIKTETTVATLDIGKKAQKQIPNKWHSLTKNLTVSIKENKMKTNSMAQTITITPTNSCDYNINF